MNPIGCYTALVTPFKEGILDEAAFIDLIKAQITGNVAGIVVAGTTGEPDLLDDEEYERIIKIAVKTAQKKITIIAGIANPSTQKAINMALIAQNCLADGLLALTPYYVRQTALGTLAHFKAIHDASSLPMIVYSNPRRTNFEITADLLQEIVKMERMVGLKDSTTDQARIQTLSQNFQSDKFSYICGEDAGINTFLDNKAKGWISVISNLFPKECQLMMENTPSPNVHSAVDVLSVDSPNPCPIKFAVSHFLKLCREDVRLPLLPLSHEEKEKIIQGIIL